MLFCAIAGFAAALFAALGFWQLARLREKVRRNDAIAAQAQSSPVPFASLPRDTALARYRAASVSGRFDYDNEIVLSGRSHQGSPGVELLTPLRPSGSDTAVLINRGWVYSADGSSVDRARWREADSATIVGYVALYMPDAPSSSSADPRTVRRVSRQQVATRIPYPVAPYYLKATGDTADGAHPARHPVPALDEGSHRGYAVQWFAFAAIAIAGAAVVVRRERASA